MKTSLIISLFMVLGIHTNPATAESPQWRVEGFEQPESVLAHPTSGQLYVSNIQGNPLEVDGQGYISLITADGKMLDQYWLTGLDAPKGMAIKDNLLYVADLKKLRIIDLSKKQLLQSIDVPNSGMLNDIAVGANGTVYVTDFLNGGIYRLQHNQLEPWIGSDLLPHPNGIFFDGDYLVVATWGENIQDDFSTTVLGSLYRVEEQSANVTLMENAREIGNLDGITRIGDRLFVNDWINGNVFQYLHGELTLAFNAGKTAADIAANGNELLVPVMFGAKVESYLP